MKRNGKARERPPVLTPVLNNEEMARCLDEVAELLDAHNANPYRVQAYRTAAVTLRDLRRPVGEILSKEGVDGLIRLPGIGESIANSIAQMVHTGRLNLLNRLRGDTEPERVLMTVPTIGPTMAQRIHEQLGIETLLDLQAAAYDGRLLQVRGFGRKRIRAVRESLAGRLRPPTRRPRGKQATAAEPPVAEILDIDREYRARAAARTLPQIAPRRFNPTGEAWLPVLHTERGSATYTALFSNTARAHELDMIRDWVVIYRDDEDGSGQWTVITAQLGPMRGRRIVRGREADCLTHYQTATPTTNGQGEKR